MKGQNIPQKFPSKREIKAEAKRDGRTKNFSFSKTHRFFYSAYMLTLVKIMVALVKVAVARNYDAIAKINGEIKETQDEFEVKALKSTKKMSAAKNAMRRARGLEVYALETVYANAKYEYELCRGEAKRKVSKKIGEAEIHKKQIEVRAEAEMANCETVIAVYWDKAKKYFKRLDACPPSVYELMDIANVFISSPDIEVGDITDTEEYLRNEGISYLPPIPHNLLDCNIPRMQVADSELNDEEGEEQ